MADFITARAASGLTSPRAQARMLAALSEQGIDHAGVLAAMGRVPRHAFIDPGLSSRAYEDVALPIGLGQTISKPSTVGRMLQTLVADWSPDTLRGARVLEIGTGCGYQAAVLAHVFGEVVSIERVRQLHEAARVHVRPLRLPNLRLVFGDGCLGLAAAAPFDAIVVAAAADAIAQPWLQQMKRGGRLVAPVRSEAGGQALHCVQRTEQDQWHLTVHDAVRFVRLQQGTC